MAEASVLQVFVFRDGNYVGNEVFTEPEVLIGHGDNVDLFLDDEFVGPNHALLAHGGGQVMLTKLGALPVRVNHGDVDRAAITPRDEIQIRSRCGRAPASPRRRRLNRTCLRRRAR
jgi:hypothetical protein